MRAVIEPGGSARNAAPYGGSVSPREQTQTRCPHLRAVAEHDMLLLEPSTSRRSSANTEVSRKDREPPDFVDDGVLADRSGIALDPPGAAAPGFKRPRLRPAPLPSSSAASRSTAEPQFIAALRFGQRTEVLARPVAHASPADVALR